MASTASVWASVATVSRWPWVPTTSSASARSSATSSARAVRANWSAGPLAVDQALAMIRVPRSPLFEPSVPGCQLRQ